MVTVFQRAKYESTPIRTPSNGKCTRRGEDEPASNLGAPLVTYKDATRDRFAYTLRPVDRIPSLLSESENRLFHTRSLLLQRWPAQHKLRLSRSECLQFKFDVPARHRMCFS